MKLTMLALIMTFVVTGLASGQSAKHSSALE